MNNDDIRFAAQIQKRLRDPEWEIKIAGGALERARRERLILRRGWQFALGAAAALLLSLFVGLDNDPAAGGNETVYLTGELTGLLDSDAFYEGW